MNRISCTYTENGNFQLSADGNQSRVFCTETTQTLLLSTTALDITEKHLPSTEFAYLIFNETEQKLLFGTDFFGTKPLFYSFQNKQLLIDSDLASLVKRLEKITINNTVLTAYFDYESNDFLIDEQTIYSEIKRVLPAQQLCWQNGKLEKKSFWKTETTDLQESTQVFHKEFRKLFLESVTKRSENTTNNAANLSGGLDSSSVVSALTFVHKKPISTYYFSGETAASDESYFADEVAIMWHSEHTTLRLDTTQLFEQQIAITNAIGQPDPLLFPSAIQAQIFKKAKDNGSEILFSGHGGDSVVGYGFDYLEQLYAKSNYRELKISLTQLSTFRENQEPKHLFLRFFVPKIKQLIQSKRVIKLVQLLFHLLFTFQLNAQDFVRYYKDTKKEKRKQPPKTKPLLRQEFRTKSSDDNRFCTKKKSLKSQHFDSNFTQLAILGNEILSTLAHQENMLVSFPFFDKELLNFSIKVPSHLRFGSGKLRFILREALQDLLPKPVYERTTKADFGEMSFRCFEALYEGFKKNETDYASLWKFIDKNEFERLTFLIFDEKYTIYKKNKSIWLAIRVINFGIWLKTVENKIV